nr:N-acetylmuramoyl-L-alanine amidase [Sphingobacterium sp. SYP-B4668]
MNRSSYVFIGAIVSCLGMVCCKSNQYSKTNKQYTAQVKEIASTLTTTLPEPKVLEDSARLIPEPVVVDKVTSLQNRGLRKDLDWVGAIHFDIRKPNYIVIHHTAQDSIKQTLRTFTLDHTKVSAHYLIGKKGEVYQLLNDYLRGWHAGVSKWGSITDMNSVSLGIELDNNGKEPFSDIQINALMTLLDTLKTNYDIPTANFIGHADIAPTRKNDPSALFPWKRLAERGFGIWYDERMLMTPPTDFNAVDALKIIGYDTRNLGAAIVAFKRKFIINDLRPELTLYDKSVLYNLYLKY